MIQHYTMYTSALLRSCFFGTPHRGSDTAYWATVLSTIAEAVQVDANQKILRDLRPDATKLEELNLDFSNVLNDKRHPSHLKIFTFQEDTSKSDVKLLGEKVCSAILVTIHYG